MGAQYTQNSLCHIQIFLCCNDVITVLEVLLLRQYQLLDGTVWFCILPLFYKVLDWALKTRVGGSIILVIKSKSPCGGGDISFHPKNVSPCLARGVRLVGGYKGPRKKIIILFWTVQILVFVYPTPCPWQIPLKHIWDRFRLHFDLVT